MEYYWRVLVLGTGEIAETYKPYRSIKGAVQAAKNYIDRGRNWESAGDLYTISIYIWPPPKDPWRMEEGPVYSLDYTRRGLTK